MKLLLDTCTLIWFADHAPKLSEAAYAAICASETEICVSPISAMELACMVERRRITLTEHWRTWWRRQLDVNGWSCRPITSEIAEEAYCLPEPIHRDPADRILIATARLETMTIVTGDELILNYPHVKTIQ